MDQRENDLQLLSPRTLTGFDRHIWREEFDLQLRLDSICGRADPIEGLRWERHLVSQCITDLLDAVIESEMHNEVTYFTYTYRRGGRQSLQSSFIRVGNVKLGVRNGFREMLSGSSIFSTKSEVGFEAS
jgi:hypothetical protein